MFLEFPFGKAAGGPHGHDTFKSHPILWPYLQSKGFRGKGTHSLTHHLTVSISIRSWLSSIKYQLRIWAETWILETGGFQKGSHNNERLSTGNWSVGPSNGDSQVLSFLPLLHTLSSPRTYWCGLSNDKCQSAQRTHRSLFRVWTQTGKENQRMERQARDGLLPLLLSQESWSCQEHCRPLGARLCGSLASAWHPLTQWWKTGQTCWGSEGGLQGWPPNRSQWGNARPPLRGRWGLLGHRLNALLSL